MRTSVHENGELSLILFGFFGNYCAHNGLVADWSLQICQLLGHKADVLKASPDVRFRGDIVAKVENRATRKISRKLISGLLRRCVAFQRHHGGPWSILDETMWSLTSPARKTHQRL